VFVKRRFRVGRSVDVMRRSSAIMSRQRWLASRRFKQRIASLPELPSAIFVS